MDLSRLAEPFPASDIGLCACGCGQRTTIANKSNAKYGWIAGKPVRFIKGHALRLLPRSANWKGGRHNNGRYIRVWAPDHLNADARGYVYEHVLIASRALGKALPDGAEVHHWNGDKTDNRPVNLVLCQDRSYHMLLEARLRAYLACGNPNWRKCSRCKRYDAPENLRRRSGVKGNGSYYHRARGGVCGSA